MFRPIRTDSPHVHPSPRKYLSPGWGASLGTISMSASYNSPRSALGPLHCHNYCAIAPLVEKWQLFKGIEGGLKHPKELSEAPLLDASPLWTADGQSAGAVTQAPDP